MSKERDSKKRIAFEGKQLLTNGAFKYVSPEFYEQYFDPETGAKYGHVLVGGALTNKPYFKELEPVVAAFSEPEITNQFNDDMKLKDMLAKKPNELSEPEKTFSRNTKTTLQRSRPLLLQACLMNPRRKRPMRRRRRARKRSRAKQMRPQARTVTARIR